MIEFDKQLINKLGLHARAAAVLVKRASGFYSDVKVSYNGKTVDGKSIMSVMMLAAPVEQSLRFSISGEDEAEAATAIQQLVDDRFGESE